MQKKLVDKLVDECTETVEEVKIARITYAEDKSENIVCIVYIVLAPCILYWWNYFLQFLLELLFFLFITTGLWLKIVFLSLVLVFAKKRRFGKDINGRNKTNKF